MGVYCGSEAAGCDGETAYLQEQAAAAEHGTGNQHHSQLQVLNAGQQASN